MKEDWKSLRLKADLKCGIRTSFRLTPKAQRKNRLVIKTKGRTYFRSVRGAGCDDKLPPCSPSQKQREEQIPRYARDDNQTCFPAALKSKRDRDARNRRPRERAGP